MIYQLYPTHDIGINIQPFSEYYAPLCVECLDSKYLPELKMEYSAMIYLYQNNIENDNWIGFTSYRQNSKTDFILNKYNFQTTLNLLDEYDILCWLFLKFNISVSDQAEFYHKKINKNIEFLFQNIFKETIPLNYYNDTCGCFANYWIMSKENFKHFMDWSYEKVLNIVELSTQIDDLKLGKHYCNSSFIIERLYVIWHMKFNKTIYPLYEQYKYIR